MLRQSNVCVVALILLLAGVTQAAHDITRPGDRVIGVPNDSDWPPNESPPLAIDDIVYTKYLHFKGDFSPNAGPTGFRVTPSVGATVVTGLTFTTANDHPGRDPTAFELYGSNTGLNGPYTLIARGPISDFAGAVSWPRFTKNARPIGFNNGIAYRHYQVLFPSIRGPAGGMIDSMQIAEVELLAGIEKATAPNPPDGAVGVVNPLLKWTKGDTAVSHNVYLGTRPNLTAADLKASRQLGASYYHGPGFQPGATYYWRVDEIAADGTIHTGSVWHFTVAGKTAYDPSPPDGAVAVDLSPALAWKAGSGAVRHDVFFGTSFEAVDAGAGDVKKTSTTSPLYLAARLDRKTTYYWRVDEFDGTRTHKGPVWSFTTEGLAGGLKGQYYSGQNFESLSLTRIDSQISFWWGQGSPDTWMEADNFSVRWTGEIEIPFSEAYTFITRTDDGVRLYVNNRLVIDNWTDHSLTDNYSEPIDLVAGQTYPIRMEFYEAWVDAVAVLEWQSPSTPRQIVPSDLLSPPYRASGPRPGNLSTVAMDAKVILSWRSGERAIEHDVYFADAQHLVRQADGTDKTGVYRGRQTGSNYVPPDNLQRGKTYYWRVDEQNNDGTVTEGSIWCFTVADYVIVDDFEAYFDMRDPWVGYSSVSLALESSVVHEGAQSIRCSYNNGLYPYSSSVERTWDEPQDWTRHGPGTLTLWYYLEPDANKAMEPLFIELRDSSWNNVVSGHSDVGVTVAGTWQRWDIDLQKLSLAGINLKEIIGLTVIVGDPITRQAGGSGKLFIDDIRLTDLAP